MNSLKRCAAGFSTALALTGLVLTSPAGMPIAPPAHADTDTDFANQLHTHDIYGSRDENAWLAKLTCKRLTTRVDGNASAATTFLRANLARTASTQQVWQFLGAAVDAYCPEQTPALQLAAASSAGTTIKEQG